MSGDLQHRPTYPSTANEGSTKVRKRPRPWRARYRGPDGREHSKSFSIKVDAERWLRTELAKADQGQWIDPAVGAITFGVWAEEWLGSLDVKSKTAVGYQELLDSRTLPTFGSTELRHISSASIRHLISDMNAEGLSASRIKQARGIMRASLEMAVVEGLIGRNPTAGVKAPTTRPREQLFLTAEAAEKTVAGTGLVVETLAYVGLRFGELAALKKESVDLKRRRLTISESASEVGGRLEFGHAEDPRNEDCGHAAGPGCPPLWPSCRR